LKSQVFVCKKKKLTVCKGPFIFDEVEGGGWWDLRKAMPKNMASKGGPAKKYGV